MGCVRFKWWWVMSVWRFFSLPSQSSFISPPAQTLLKAVRSAELVTSFTQDVCFSTASHCSHTQCNIQGCTLAPSPQELEVSIWINWTTMPVNLVSWEVCCGVVYVQQTVLALSHVNFYSFFHTWFPAHYWHNLSGGTSGFHDSHMPLHSGTFCLAVFHTCHCNAGTDMMTFILAAVNAILRDANWH